MGRYIDADKAISESIRIGFHSTTMTIKEFLDTIPTADVRENVRGEWIDAYPDIEKNPMFNHGICSKCGFEQGLSNKLNFCPNCGAEMKKQLKVDPLDSHSNYSKSTRQNSIAKLSSTNVSHEGGK